MVVNQITPPKSKKELAKQLGVSRQSLYYKPKLPAKDLKRKTVSDQGSEYRGKNYLNLLKSLDIKPSMSQKASPWQNGHKESFYSNFKMGT